MARHSHDREDLLRDATAFIERIQMRVTIGGTEQTVFVGFRPNGAASFYFDQDPVFHFNDHRALRRAFVDDVLYKAEAARLVSLRRIVDPAETTLLRHELTIAEQADLLMMIRQRLTQLRHCLHGRVTVEGEVSTSLNSVAEQVLGYLSKLDSLEIAETARVAG